ncbi:septum site-determining protein MinD [Thermocrinis albus DSM 14484]|uniref:Septum site-determining protein MinD n=1 Tax=Thermocrinis albus (strain DSM 14484 / JCM 11386 / HI 11/12) TaxID=638303 RepID=D3SM32_THEAH|nr:septum site-determining protein MinD [Thermocrinis albus]ADC89812.1 septum site-determining protein MinD [Thermocrinis albus DSM 14484]
MTKVFVVTSGKGGVGKTTLTANISVALAKLGKKVLDIDADIGLRNLDMILGLENRIVYDVLDVLEGRVEFSKALVKDKRGLNLWLLPANQTKNKDAVDPERWVKMVEEVKSSGQYDYIFIDSPAGIERGFQIASLPADAALVVVNPEVSSVRDADRIIGMLENMGKNEYYLVVNRIRWDAVKKGQMLSVEDVVDILKAPLIGVVPEEPKLVDFTNRGEPIVLEDSYPASKAILDIARRLLGEEVPMVYHGQKRSIIERIFGGGA